MSIRSYVPTFLTFARERTDLRFQLTPIGCGLAGYRPDQIAPMFADDPANATLRARFARLSKLKHRYAKCPKSTVLPIAFGFRYAKTMG